MISLPPTPDAMLPIGAKVIDLRAPFKHGTVLAVLDDGTVRVRWEWETRCARLCVREEAREHLALAGPANGKNGTSGASNGSL